MKKSKGLTPTEQLYFDALVAKPAGCSREELHPLKAEVPRMTNLVDVRIKDMRRKLKKEGYAIEAIRGFGYKLVKTK